MTSHLRRRKAKQFTSNEISECIELKEGEQIIGENQAQNHIRMEILNVYMATYISVLSAEKIGT